MKKFLAAFVCISMLISLIPAFSVSANTAVAPEKPRVNNRVDPLGIDLDEELRFSWVMNSSVRGDYQTAYRIVVSSENGDGDMWDSGKVASDQSLSIPYAGPALSSKSIYRVKVKTWDKNGNESPFSDEATFETAFLNDGEWEAAWITYSSNLNYMRKDFAIPTDKTIKRARAYVTGQGIYYLYLNGQKVGDRYLDPMRTYYYGDNARILYSTFDITNYLQGGNNAAGILLNDGYRSASGNRKAICQIEIAFTDGSTMQVLTDQTWKGYAGGPYIEAAASGIAEIEEYLTKQYANYAYYEDGEIYDARKESEIDGWNMPGFDDSSWVNVTADLPAVHGGVFNAREVEMLSTAPGITDWNNHTYSARFRTNDAQSYVALKFAYSDAGYGYMWQLCGNVIRPHYSNPNYGLFGHYTMDNNFSIQPGTWYTLSIKLYSDKIETYIDNTLVNTLTASQMENAASGASGYRTGKFGIRQAITDDCDIDWISVTDGSGTEVWRDDFNNADYWNLGTMRRVSQKSGTVVNDRITPTLIANDGNVLRYDAGKNISGFVEATFNGPAGGRAIIKCAEAINDDGTLDRDSYFMIVGGAEAAQFTAANTDYYTLKGAAGGERYTPLFTSHGFRYFEIHLPEGTTVSDVTAVSISADITPIAEFESSNNLINMFYEGFMQGTSDNTIFFPHGGNNRKERHAWMMDGAIVTEATLTYLDSAPFFEKWLDDIADGDMGNGFAANITPNEGIDSNPDPIWTSGTVTVAYDYYMETGDITYLESYYPRAKRYAEAVRSFESTGHLISQGNGLNSHWTDWMALYNNDYGIGSNDKGNREFYMNAYYFYVIDCMQRMATALGYSDDAATYGTLRTQIKNAINDKFYANGSYDINLGDGQYDDGRGEVASNAVALAFGITEDSQRAATAAKIVNGFINPPQKSGYSTVETMHPTFGVLGTRTIFEALVKSGYESELFEMSTQTTFPSYGYMMLNGPGTYWENWTGDLSLNHPFFGGGIASWVLNSIGGIKNVGVAYDEIEIRPFIDDESLTYANSALDSPRGRIVSNWTKTATEFSLSVTVPANTTAKVYIPVPENEVYTVTEGNTDITARNSNDITYVEATDDNYLVYQIGSGTYVFTRTIGAVPSPVGEAFPTLAATPIYDTDFTEGTQTNFGTGWNYDYSVMGEGTNNGTGLAVVQGGITNALYSNMLGSDEYALKTTVSAMIEAGTANAEGVGVLALRQIPPTGGGNGTGITMGDYTYVGFHGIMLLVSQVDANALVLSILKNSSGNTTSTRCNIPLTVPEYTGNSSFNIGVIDSGKTIKIYLNNMLAARIELTGNPITGTLAVNDPQAQNEQDLRSFTYYTSGTIYDAAGNEYTSFTNSVVPIITESVVGFGSRAADAGRGLKVHDLTIWNSLRLPTLFAEPEKTAVYSTNFKSSGASVGDAWSQTSTFAVNPSKGLVLATSTSDRLTYNSSYNSYALRTTVSAPKETYTSGDPRRVFVIGLRQPNGYAPTDGPFTNVGYMGVQLQFISAADTAPNVADSMIIRMFDGTSRNPDASVAITVPFAEGKTLEDGVEIGVIDSGTGIEIYMTNSAGNLALVKKIEVLSEATTSGALYVTDNTPSTFDYYTGVKVTDAASGTETTYADIRLPSASQTRISYAARAGRTIETYVEKIKLWDLSPTVVFVNPNRTPVYDKDFTVSGSSVGSDWTQSSTFAANPTKGLVLATSTAAKLSYNTSLDKYALRTKIAAPTERNSIPNKDNRNVFVLGIRQSADNYPTDGPFTNVGHMGIQLQFVSSAGTSPYAADSMVIRMFDGTSRTSNDESVAIAVPFADGMTLANGVEIGVIDNGTSIELYLTNIDGELEHIKTIQMLSETTTNGTLYVNDNNTATFDYYTGVKVIDELTGTESIFENVKLPVASMSRIAYGSRAGRDIEHYIENIKLWNLSPSTVVFTNIYESEGSNATSYTQTFASSPITVSLKPVSSLISLSGTKVVSAHGYFKGWSYSDNQGKNGTYTLDYYTLKDNEDAVNVTLSDVAANGLRAVFTAMYDTERTSSNGIISEARAQRVVTADGTKAIRFLALLDENFLDSQMNIYSYSNIGFVITDIAPNPTVEAGYQYSQLASVYRKIKVNDQVLDARDSTIGEAFGNFSNGRAFVYATLKINDDNEDKTYYATPYVEYKDEQNAVHRIYGKTRAISYAQLNALDLA